MNVVITGTDSGLGAVLERAFDGMNHTVIGSSTSMLVNGQPYLDLANDHSINEYADRVLNRFTKIDVLINNAGINGIRPFDQLDPAFVRTIMQVNCVGPVMLTRRLLPVLKDGGIIVNITSDAAHRPMRHSLAYNCSKAAFDMATKQMARELTKPYGLSIIGIRPGRMRGTKMSCYIDEQVCQLRDWTPEQCSEYFRANSVTGEEAWPSAVAQTIYELVTGPLVRNLSGACLDLVG